MENEQDWLLMATYTHDVPDDVDALLQRLRLCDGVNSDCCVLVWEHAQRLVVEIERLKQLALAKEA